MIAEIHGKISRNGSTLHDRREDQLTGDFFGSIRYLPFEIGLLPVLLRAQRRRGAQTGAAIPQLRQVTGYSYDLRFWPQLGQDEIEVLLAAPAFTCGIEVKYLSGLSSDDSVNDSDDSTPEERIRDSRNQLESVPKG
jgi:hypothetical protein